jgi:rhodanese-related sulfurtransferase
VPYGVLVIAVVLIAVGGFVGAEWLEVKFGGAERSAQPLLGAVGLGGSRRLMLGFAALGLTAALAGSPYVGSTATFNTDELTLDVVRANDHMTPEQLADRLIAAVDVPRIVDLRDPAAFARTHLPGATNVPMAGLGREPWRVDETVLLYSGADPHAEQAWMLLKARKFPRVYTLQGGIDAWNEQVLFPRIAEADSDAARRKIAVAHAFGGTPRTEGAAPAALEAAPMPVAPPPAVSPAAGDSAPRKKKRLFSRSSGQC